MKTPLLGRPNKRKCQTRWRILILTSLFLFILLTILPFIIYSPRYYKLNINDLVLIGNVSSGCLCTVCVKDSDCTEFCVDWNLPYFGSTERLSNPYADSHCTYIVPAIPPNNYTFKYEMLVTKAYESYINLSWINTENQPQQVSLELSNGRGSIYIADVVSEFKIHIKREAPTTNLFLRNVRFEY